MQSFSIIVPVLNEGRLVKDLIDQLRILNEAAPELVLVDGGSVDGTADLLAEAGFRIVHAGRGRARALNAGAAASTGTILIFLHADTVLPVSWEQDIRNALEGDVTPWGRFDVCIDGRSALLPLVAQMMNFRSRVSGIATGDQAIFMTRNAFEQAGGFPDQPLMEDVEMSLRLKKISAPACLRSKVVTSGRRWDARGAFATICLMWLLRLLYWLGVPSRYLASFYR